MIVVIADDLSGAAELAGTAVRHGLSAEVQTAFDPATTGVEVVCIDTNTRQLSAADAANRLTAVTLGVTAVNPAWIFKKCDSVLRGPVLAEARAVAAVAGRPRLRLVPANPSRGRTIKDGIYLVAGQPLNKTLFATDPTHPRLTADVKILLDGDLAQVVVPDIASGHDVQRQAELVDAATLPVGGADFFAALLLARVPRGFAAPPLFPVTSKTLLVCGSGAAWQQRHSEATARGASVFSVPHDIPAALSALRTNESVLIGIGNGPETRSATSSELTGRLAQSVAAILRAAPVERLLLEGGATAAAVITALGWTRLRAEQADDSGLAVLRPVAAQGPMLVIKPGSYPWPATFWP